MEVDQDILIQSNPTSAPLIEIVKLYPSLSKIKITNKFNFTSITFVVTISLIWIHDEYS
jgi:hypothetical protein